MKKIVLLGMMGSGKSSVARYLAKNKKIPFYDLDFLIEKKEGITIAQIFSSHGESFFREKETAALKELLKKKYGLLSLGGGAFSDEKNRKSLLSSCLCVYLKASANCLLERVKRTSHRPLLQTDNPLKILQQLLSQREAFYKQAHLTLNVERLSIQEVGDQVWQFYEKCGIEES